MRYVKGKWREVREDRNTQWEYGKEGQGKGEDGVGGHKKMEKVNENKMQ